MILYSIISNIQFVPGHAITKYHLLVGANEYGMHKGVPSLLSHLLVFMASLFLSSSNIMSDVTPDNK